MNIYGASLRRRKLLLLAEGIGAYVNVRILPFKSPIVKQFYNTVSQYLNT